MESSLSATGRTVATRIGAIVLIIVAAAIAVSAVANPPAPRAQPHTKYGHFPFRPGQLIESERISRVELLPDGSAIGLAPIETFSGRLLATYLVVSHRPSDPWTVWSKVPAYPLQLAMTVPKRQTSGIDPGFIAANPWGFIRTSAGLFFTTDGNTFQRIGSPEITVTKISPGSSMRVLVGCQLSVPNRSGCYPRDFTATVNPGSHAWHDRTYLPYAQSTNFTQSAPDVLFTMDAINAHLPLEYSTNEGVSWRKVHAPCANNEIDTVAATDSFNFYVACHSGGVQYDELFASNDRGATWQRRGPFEFPQNSSSLRGGSGVLFDFVAPDLLMSTDGGRSWQGETVLSALAAGTGNGDWASSINHGSLLVSANVGKSVIQLRILDVDSCNASTTPTTTPCIFKELSSGPWK